MTGRRSNAGPGAAHRAALVVVRPPRAAVTVVVAVASAAAVAPGPASAATASVAYAPRAVIGPVQAGPGLAWGEGRSAEAKPGPFRLRYAVAGGAATTLVAVPDRPRARPEWGTLLGSPTRIAFTRRTLRDARDPFASPDLLEESTGTVTVGPGGPVPAAIPALPAGRPLHLAGDLLLSDRSEEQTSRLLLSDLAGAAPEADVTPPAAAAAPAVAAGFGEVRAAGSFVAFAQRRAGPDLNEPSVIGLYRRDIGAVLYRLTLPDLTFRLADVTPDGRVLVTEEVAGSSVVAGSRGWLHVVDPSPVPRLRRIATDLAGLDARAAGDVAIAPRRTAGMGEQLAAYPIAGGVPRNVGAPATGIAGFAVQPPLWPADSTPAGSSGGLAAWRTDDGCILQAGLTDPAERALPAGPCPRSGATFVGRQGLTAGRDRTLRTTVGCPAAPAPGCRGTLVLRLAAVKGRPPVTLARARLAVPPAATRRAALRISKAKTRISARRGGDAELRATVADPAGRRRVTTLRFFLEVPGTPPAR